MCALSRYLSQVVDVRARNLSPVVDVCLSRYLSPVVDVCVVSLSQPSN